MARAAAVTLVLTLATVAAQEHGSLRGGAAAHNTSAPNTTAARLSEPRREAAAVVAGSGLSVNASSQALLQVESSYGSERLQCASTFVAPYWPRSDNNCYWTGSCCDPSMTCYVKQPGLFAACMPSCTPGVHHSEPFFFWYPWRCSVVQPTAPTPTPAPTPAPAPAPAGPSNAETFTFYMYRAQSDANYPPKNVNTANLAGVMWYLTHEVMIKTPPKFGITRVLRYKVQTKAPQRLIDAGMNFGVRYAYDSQECTGPGNCAKQYEHWGNFVGCNNLGDFPYPKFNTHFPGGIWYSLPGSGECSGPPTGDFGCTYSYEAAGNVTLAEIAASAMKNGPASVFAESSSDAVNAAKVSLLESLFESKYPGQPATMDSPPCDFNYQKFYPNGLV